MYPLELKIDKNFRHGNGENGYSVGRWAGWLGGWLGARADGYMGGLMGRWSHGTVDESARRCTDWSVGGPDREGGQDGGREACLEGGQGETAENGEGRGGRGGKVGRQGRRNSTEP